MKLIDLGNLMIISVIISVSLLCGCIANNDTEGQYTNSYTIDINLITPGKFTIIIPIPDKWNDMTSFLKIVEGSANYSIVNTNYGEGINITGNNDVSFQAISKSDESKGNYSLTMYNQNNGTIPMFLNSGTTTEISIIIDSYYKLPNGGSGISVNTDLLNGWHSYKVDLYEID